MRKRTLAVLLMTALSVSCLGGCGGEQKEQTEATVTGENTEKEESKSSAAFMIRTGNPDTVSLNAQDVYMEDTSISWVKIATIWDPELILYDATSFVQGSKAVAVTFEVSGMDVDPTTCYWNYMIADSEGNEISCWDTSYQTDDVEITGDGRYQMVFDCSKVEGGDVAELKSLQLVFPGMKADTTTKVKVTEAVCVTDEAELGTVYKTGKVEE